MIGGGGQHLVAALLRRYFLRKLRRVKKANGQILAINEVGSGQGGGRDALLHRPHILF